MPRKKANAIREDKQQQINLLQAATERRYARRRMTRHVVYGLMLAVTLTGVGIGTHIGLSEFVDRALYQNPQYNLRRIVIEARNNYSQAQIRKASGVELGGNIWRLDMRQIQANIERLPYVAEARVEKRLPHTLVIQIVERTPLVRLTGQSEFGTQELFFIDRESHVLFRPRDDQAAEALPELVGLAGSVLRPGRRVTDNRVLSALDLILRVERMAMDSQMAVRAIDVSDALSMRMQTEDGAILALRYDVIGQQLLRLREILEYANKRGLRLASADLRLDRNVPVRFRPPAPPSNNTASLRLR